MPTKKPATVSEYIAAAPKEAQKHLREIRSILKKVAPHATETLKWGSPVFEEKRILFAYSAYKSHLNFMPTGPALEPFMKELAEYKTGEDTIQFPYGKPLPKADSKNCDLSRQAGEREGRSMEVLKGLLNQF